MSSCKDCGEKKAQYFHYNGMRICKNCIGNYFTCPSCGRLFDHDDYQHADAGTGKCVECEKDAD